MLSDFNRTVARLISLDDEITEIEIRDTTRKKWKEKTPGTDKVRYCGTKNLNEDMT